MKRRTVMSQIVRGTKGAGMSKYLAKVTSGRQMYGPGCCAHTTKARRVAQPFLPDLILGVP